MEVMDRWLKKAKNTMMIYAILLATMVLVLVLLLIFKISFKTTVGILFGFIVASTSAAISTFFEEKREELFIKAIVFGAISAVIFITVKGVPAIVDGLMFIVMLAAMGYVLYWWYQEGSTVKELLVFTLLQFFLGCVAGAAVEEMLGTSQGPVIGILAAIPMMLFFVSVGYFVANMFWFKQELSSYGERGGE